MGKQTSRARVKGFTLIELIIYIGIFSIAAGLLTGVLTTFTRVQVRQNATAEVSGQAQFVIQTIQRLITDASLIELTKDASVSTLKLRMPVAANDPTCIQFSNGTVYLMQGNAGGGNCYATSTAQAKALTSSKVVVNSLTFKKFENPPSTDTVKIDLTISYNSTNSQESAISRTLQTAIAKVSAATFDSDIIPAADATSDVGIGANRWRDGFFSRSLSVGYSSALSGGVAAFGGAVGVNTSTFSGLFTVATSSINVLTAANSGNVGIGTTSPNAKLQVNGVITTGAGITTGTTAGDISIPSGRAMMYSNAAASDTIRLIQGLSDTAISIGQSTTDVGIGNTSPSTYGKLAVSVGNSSTMGFTMSSGAGGAAGGFQLNGYYGSVKIGYIDNELTDGTGGSEKSLLRFATIKSGTLTEAMRIDNLGNVGIGVSPTRKVDIVSSVDSSNQTALAVDNIDFKIAASNPASVNKGLYWHSVPATGGSTAYSYIYREQTTGKLFMGSQGAGTILETANSGNVGIGIATPTSKLQVAGGDVGLGNATATGNQPVTIWLTNGSGVQRVAGEIVIIGSTDDSFTVTAGANDKTVLGIVYDTTIAIGAVGRIAVGGVVPVLSAGATTRGYHVLTSTTSGKAGSVLDPPTGGSIGRWLQTLGGASTGRALIRY